MTENNKYLYIYNLHWANYLVLNGGKVTGIGINKKTKCPYVAFDYDSTREAYRLYEERK